MRARKSVQPVNVQNRQPRVHRRLGIRRIKSARLRRVRVSVEGHLQGPLDVRNLGVDLQKHAAVMTRRNGKTASRRPSKDSLIILLRRAEPGIKFFRGKVMPVGRAGWIVKLLRKLVSPSRFRKGRLMESLSRFVPSSRPSG